MSEPDSAPDAKGIVDAENPWPGPEAFREADEAFFFGRDRARDELTRLVLENRLIVLYGRSGLGKTSLLQAGVFRRLRDALSLPIHIRLKYPAAESSTSSNLRGQVRAAIENAARARHVEAPALAANLTLWEWFYRSEARFFNERSRRVRPVLVFDQFEEAFTLGRSTKAIAAATDQFLEELVDLVRGSVPRSVAARLEQDSAQALEFTTSRDPCGILIALRQEFLPELLRLRAHLPSLLDRRFELTAMTTADAEQVINGPGGHLVEQGVASRVALFVAGARRSADDSTSDETTVDPAILSIFCRELNATRRERGLERITAELVAGEQDSIIADFYARGVADVEPGVRQFIEDRLVTPSGYRNSEALEEALRSPGVSEEAIDLLIERRLLRREGSGPRARLELTHDVLTEPIVKSRNLRRLREQENEARAAEEEERRAAEEARDREYREQQLQAKKEALHRQRLINVALGVVLVGSLALGFYFYNNYRMGQERERAAALLLQAEALRRSAPAPLDLSLRLAIEALRLSRSAEAVHEISEITRVLPRPNARLEHDGPVRSILFDPEEQLVATLSETHQAVLWRVPSGERVEGLRHDGRVNALAFRPDGKTIATAGSDNQAKLWNHQGKELGRLPHDDAVNGVAFRPDKLMIATASDDRSVRLWDVTNPQSPREVDRALHNAAAHFAAFNRSGDLLATAGDDGVRLWRVAPDGKVENIGGLPRSPAPVAMVFPQQAGIVEGALDWPQNVEALVTADARPDVRFWPVPRAPQPLSGTMTHVRLKLRGPPTLTDDAGSLVTLLSAHHNAQAGFIRLPENTGARGTVWSSGSALTMTPNRGAQLWDVGDGWREPEEIARFIQERVVVSGALANHAPIAVTADDTGTAMIWTWPTRGHQPSYSALSRDGRRTASLGEPILVWQDAPFASPFAVLEWPTAAPGTSAEFEARGDTGGPAPSHVALSSDGALLAAASDRMLAIWNLATPEGRPALTPLPPKRQQPKERPPSRLRSKQLPEPEPKEEWDRLVPGFALENGVLLIPKRNLIEVRDGAPSDKVWSRAVSGITSAMLSPNGNFIATTRADGDLDVWSRTPDAARRIALDGRPTRLAFNPAPDSTRVGLCSDINQVRLLDATTGTDQQTFEVQSPCRSLAFDRTGRYLAIGTEEGAARVLDLSARQVGAPMRMNAPVSAVAFSSDGRHLAATSDDGLAHVWDLRTGLEVSRFLRRDRIVHRPSLAFAAGDRFVYADGEMYAWKVEDVIEQACRYVTRNLTETEWRNYLGDRTYAPTCNIAPVLRSKR
jgi:WD40 repeat protein